VVHIVDTHHIATIHAIPHQASTIWVPGASLETSSFVEEMHCRGVGCPLSSSHLYDTSVHPSGEHIE
jgi:hypothetical protein